MKKRPQSDTKGREDFFFSSVFLRVTLWTFF
jgi:hypothetical protein